MINKKNLLGKTPGELGLKDAIHTAIVSVRAGKPIKPGQRCGLNKDREAVPDEKGPGVADPFRTGTIIRGMAFWLLLNQDEVPNVRHEWEHPTVDFSPPAIEVKQNTTIKSYADAFGVTYEQIMEAAEYVVEKDKTAVYPGSKTAEEMEAAWDDRYDFWSEWADETLHEFYNAGTECCPEWQYPDCDLFQAKS